MPKTTTIRTAVSKLSVAGTAAAAADCHRVGVQRRHGGPATGVDVEDVTEEDYFGTDEFVGESVTLSAEVTDVLGQRSFELAGGRGDESLLVLTEHRCTRR
ncbi:hypothetical protein R1X32_10135 (plasmid) [Rhodococcus opacus]|uniref:hypothetical protein n=1 Tax=Rhodococcus opacus TaxID=37919 RepID=UPI0034D1F17D